jgi:hypothetical protein
MRSSSRRDTDSTESQVRDPYIGMVIPEEIAEAMMVLMIRLPEYRPKDLE